MIFSAHELAGEMFTWKGSNPSGCPITSELNSIYNIIAILFCVFRTTKSLPNAKSLAYLVYGDDNLISVDSNLKEKMTPEAWRDGMAALGMTYTAADKTGPPRYDSIEDVEFLRRGFRPVRGRVLSPLNKETLYGMIHFLRNKGNVSEMKQRVSESVIEMSQHPQELFDPWQKLMKDALLTKNIQSLPTVLYEPYQIVQNAIEERSGEFRYV